MAERVRNFGRNLDFSPREILAPRDEDELLAMMDARRGRKMRVVGAGHAWSDGIVCDDVLFDLRHLCRVTTVRGADGEVLATIGGGARIKHLLTELRREGVTLPTLGLITKQSIAGATATGTHGSGNHSMSHFLIEVRVANFDPQSGAARIETFTGGDELRAARCSLGCLGIVVSVTLRCVAPYRITEVIRKCASVEDALALEHDSPLQQFFLIPHSWQVYSQCRRAEPPATKPSWHAGLFRAYRFLGIDVGFHLAVLLLARVLRSRRIVRWFYRWLFARMVICGWRVTDESQNALVMAHELFRHVELELFVPARHVRQTARLVREIVDVFAGSAADVSDEMDEELRRFGWEDFVRLHHGYFAHHYPICVRKVLADDTLISMSSGDDGETVAPGEAWYAFSFITYGSPPDLFFQMANCLARCTLSLYGARLHWGKWFPLSSREIEQTYPGMKRFREIVALHDPQGLFCNAYAQRVLGCGEGADA
jgi:hypothetical protein